jgi:hypothetical protein
LLLLVTVFAAVEVNYDQSAATVNGGQVTASLASTTTSTVLSSSSISLGASVTDTATVSSTVTPNLALGITGFPTGSVQFEVSVNGGSWVDVGSAVAFSVGVGVGARQPVEPV